MQRAVQEIDDATLVLGIQRRDQAAFEMLYRRHAPAVHALIYRTVRDVSIADELTQTVFLRLWERASTIQTAGLRLRAWLMTVAIHAIRDDVRRRRPTVSIDDVLHPVSAERTEDRAVATERRAFVRAALDTLPSDQRCAVDLAYFGGLSQAEIADVLEQPLGTIKGRIRLAMQKLRGALGPLGESYV